MEDQTLMKTVNDFHRARSLKFIIFWIIIEKPLKPRIQNFNLSITI